MSNNPYAANDWQNQPTPTPSPSGKPSNVRFYQKLYIGFMVVLYIVVAVMGAVLFLNAEQLGTGQNDPQELAVMGVVYGFMGVVLAILFGLGLVFQKGMLGWVWNLILIALGLTSCCTWPATIPLMIYWIKDKDHIVAGS